MCDAVPTLVPKSASNPPPCFFRFRPHRWLISSLSNRNKVEGMLIGIKIGMMRVSCMRVKEGQEGKGSPEGLTYTSSIFYYQEEGGNKC